MKENIFIVLPIKEFDNILNESKLSSYKRVHVYFELQNVQDNIVSIIKEDKKQQEYCCLSSKVTEEELKFYKMATSRIKYETILEQMVSVYYLLLKDEKLELINFDFDKNFDFIKMILDLKKNT